jgi:hypothetical protein
MNAQVAALAYYYSSKSDEELSALANRAGGYLPEARAALSQELARRGLDGSGVAPSSRELLLSFLGGTASTPPSSVGAGLIFVGLAIALLFLLTALRSGEFGIFFGIIPGLAFTFVASKLEKMISTGHRLRAEDALEVLSSDRRPLVLYLRSFVHDKEDKASFFFLRPKTAETRLVKSLKTLGPVVALGKPSDDLPSLGAPRLRFADSSWQPGAVLLLKDAQFALIHPGATGGVLWEIRQAVAILGPAHLAFYFPKGRIDDETRSALVQLLPEGSLPVSLGRHAFLAFEMDWTPKVYPDVNALLRNHTTSQSQLHTPSG